MKHLFVARHGQYGEDNRINNYGRERMGILGQAIKEILHGGSAYIVSSTAPRALDSSQVLAVQLALPEVEQVPYIWTGMDAPEDSFYYDWDLNKLMGIVNQRRDKADGLVMVTHLEVVRKFPEHFFEKEFGIARLIPSPDKAKAVHFDLEKRACCVVPG